MSLFSRIRNVGNNTKQNFTVQKAATTLPLDRPLTPEEHSLAEHLLRHAAVPGVEAFVTQLAYARVTGQCSCGCPTVDLTVPPELRISDPPAERPIADATGRVDGKLAGVMIFQTQGLLTCLEIYRLEDVSDDPFGLPPVETIERLEWKKPGQSKP
jgi:hypothetical protein